MAPAVCTVWSPGAMLAALAGPWRLQRRISGLATMEGTAVFAPQQDGSLLYTEQGRVTLADGRTHQAHQRYLYQPLPQGFSVWFPEQPPRLFHTMDLQPQADGSLCGSALHGCGDDTYRSHYRFAPDGSWVLTHVVQGPRKDYSSSTHFQRANGTGQLPPNPAADAFL